MQHNKLWIPVPNKDTSYAYIWTSTQNKKWTETNAAIVPRNLGGGTHGHLGSIPMVVNYTNVVLIQYIWPLHPFILNIPASTTNYESTRLPNKLEELVRLRRKVNNMEVCLLKQLGKFLPDLYFKSFWDKYYNTSTHRKVEKIKD